MTTRTSSKSRTTKRPNVRWGKQRAMKRGGSDHTVVPATTAYAGIPGFWGPSGSTPPATVAALIAGTPNVVTASPTTAWTEGQFVQVQTDGTDGHATWDGAAWIAGVGPEPEEP